MAKRGRKKKTTTKVEKPLKDYKEEDKEEGDSIFDSADAPVSLKNDNVTAEPVRKVEPKEVHSLFDKKRVARMSNLADGISNMVNRSMAPGSKADLNKIISHSKKIQVFSDNEKITKLANSLITESKNTVILRDEDEIRDNLRVLEKIVSDILEELNHYERHG